MRLVESVHPLEQQSAQEENMSRDRRIVVVGSLNADLVQPADRLPAPGETLRGRDLSVIPGGKGANQACAVGRLGGDVIMIGNVGCDPFGNILLDSLRSCGVDSGGIEVVNGSSGTASILVLPGGENGIVISPGANARLTASDVIRRIQPFVVKILLCQLEVPLEATEAALERARSLGALTILDPAPAQALSREILSWVDYLTPNQNEALALLERDGSSIDTFDDAIRAAQELLELGPSNVILKCGRQGCILASRAQIHAVPGFDVDAIDSTGAGDIFNGAFATALAEGRQPVEAAVFANAAAAISVTRIGAQSSIPSRSEVDQFLQAVPTPVTG
jgi:ribokinase